MDPNQLKLYLKHIGCNIKPVSLDYLKEISEAHIFCFPYESINIHDSQFDNAPQKRSSLSINALIQKLVKNGRGGRCVELNLLLQNALIELGFDVRPILPECLYNQQNKSKQNRPKHSAAIVTIEGQEYLVDAGFGGAGILSPMPLIPGVYKQFSEKFKLIQGDDCQYVIQINRNDQWIDLFGFDKTTATLNQYAEVDHTNRDPNNLDSYFKQYFVCTMPFKMSNNRNGRYRLCNEEYIEFRDAKQEIKQAITSQQQFHQYMKEKFKIDLRNSYIRHRPLDMLAFREGFRQPPNLHRYNTRHKFRYEMFLKEQNPNPEQLAYKPSRKKI